VTCAADPEDAAQHGQSFTVTRDDQGTAELIPLRRRPRRQQFAAMSRDAPSIDIEAFRADQDAAVDHVATGGVTSETTRVRIARHQHCDSAQVGGSS
jgi:antitoxin (DNA-binding transcriptional repressor) of toxin-antitoxin stability system